MLIKSVFRKVMMVSIEIERYVIGTLLTQLYESELHGGQRAAGAICNNLLETSSVFSCAETKQRRNHPKSLFVRGADGITVICNYRLQPFFFFFFFLKLK
jgi:hypothetical protein